MLKLFESSKKFQAARKYSREFSPEDGRSYQWTLHYANEQYARLEDVMKSLDSKAESILKYAGLVVSGVSIVAATAKVPWVVVWPTLLLVAAAVLCSVIALAPRSRPLPHPITTALGYASAGEFKDESAAQGAFAAKLHEAAVAMHLFNNRKGRSLQWAFALFAGATVWLAFALLVSRAY